MIAIRLSAPFIKQGIANLGVRKRLEATQGSEFNFVVVAQNLTTPKAEDRITSLLFVAKGDFLHGLSAIPAKSIFTVWLKSQCFLLFPVFQVLVWQHFVRCNLQFRWSTKGLWHRKVGQKKECFCLVKLRMSGREKSAGHAMGEFRRGCSVSTNRRWKNSQCGMSRRQVIKASVQWRCSIESQPSATSWRQQLRNMKLQGLLRTVRNKPHSAPANQVLGTTEHRMLPAQHTWEPALQPNRGILDMIQGAATAGPLPEQLLLVCLDTFIETATAAFLDALDDSEKPTARPYLQISVSTLLVIRSIEGGVCAQ